MKFHQPYMCHIKWGNKNLEQQENRHEWQLFSDGWRIIQSNIWMNRPASVFFIAIATC